MSLILLKVKRLQCKKVLMKYIHKALNSTNKLKEKAVCNTLKLKDKYLKVYTLLYKNIKTKKVQKKQNNIAHENMQQKSGRYVMPFGSAKKKQEETKEYLNEVRRAWVRWQNAVSYFNNVTDPELVEYAIYNVEAARRQYMFMVKNAKFDSRSNENVKDVSSALNVIREVNDITL